jgi:hypothetical protein
VALNGRKQPSIHAWLPNLRYKISVQQTLGRSLLNRSKILS